MVRGSRLALVFMRTSHRPYLLSAPDHLAAMPPVVPLASPWTIALPASTNQALGRAGPVRLLWPVLL